MAHSQPHSLQTDLSKYLLQSTSKGGPPPIGLKQLNWEASKFLADPLEASVRDVVHAHSKFVEVVHGLNDARSKELAGATRGPHQSLSANLQDGIETLEDAHLQLLLCRDEVEALEAEIRRMRDQDVERLRTIKELRQQLRAHQPSERPMKCSPAPTLVVSARRTEGDPQPSAPDRLRRYFVLVDVQLARQHLESLPVVAAKALTVLWGVVEHLVPLHHGQRIQPVSEELGLESTETPGTPERASRRLTPSAMFVFVDGLDAVAFTTAVQEQLLAAAWDDRALGWPDTAAAFKSAKAGGADGPPAAEVAPMAVPDAVPADSALRRPSISLPVGLLWKGLRVRAGVHYGAATPLEQQPDGWVGPALEKVARLTALATGGETLLSADCLATLPELPLCPNVCLSALALEKVRGFSRGEAIHRLVPASLKAREFLPASPEQFSDLSYWWTPTTAPVSLVVSLDDEVDEKIRELTSAMDIKVQKAHAHVEALSAAAHRLMAADAFHFRLSHRLRATAAELERGWMATHDADAGWVRGERLPARLTEDLAAFASGRRRSMELQLLAERYPRPWMPPKSWAAAQEKLVAALAKAHSVKLEQCPALSQKPSGVLPRTDSAMTLSATLERAHTKLRLFYALTQRLVATAAPPETTSPRAEPLSGQDFIRVWTDALDDVFHWGPAGLKQPRERFLAHLNAAALPSAAAGPLRSDQQALQSMCGFLGRLFVLLTATMRSSLSATPHGSSTAIQSSRAGTPPPCMATPASAQDGLAAICPTLPKPPKPAKAVPFAIDYRTQRLHAAWDARREELGKQRLEREKEVEQQRLTEQKMQRQLRHLAKDLTAMMWYEQRDEDPPVGRPSPSRNPRLAPQPPESPESGWPVRWGSPPKRGGRDAVADPGSTQAPSRSLAPGLDMFAAPKVKRGSELPLLNSGAAVVGLTYADL